MSAFLILIIGLVLLGIGYVTYGSWLAKKWGVNPDRPTPAHTKFDNRDFVPANPAVLMGHHFSSIAGAGPINGPIQAAVFGWLPVFLWIVIGGIFFGAMHDFGALFASIRHGGRSIGEVIKDNIGGRAYKLFITFALIVLILVIAAFTSVVASTFVSVAPEGSPALSFFTMGSGNVSANAATSTTSLLFIVMAFFFGYAVYRKNAKIGPATIIGVIGIVVITWIGLNVGVNMSRTAWVVFIAVYITVASLLPVWILLQPRDYLSSFLLYGMILLAVIGVIGSGAQVEVPAFTSFQLANGNMLFPTLFITVACGAISGFHALVGSGTTAKQLSTERDAKVIGYGAMIIECVLAILSLLAVGVVWNSISADPDTLKAALAAPPKIFASGIASMVAWTTGSEAVAGNKVYDLIYTLLTLAVSVFALTSLDTGTRLGRYMFTELFTREGEDPSKITGIRGFLAKPIVGTLCMVVVGCTIGFLKLSQIWGVFGAANQLLAGLALLAVACWLGNIGKSNKMFFVPMVFMLIATLVALFITIGKKFSAIGGGTAVWGDWFQLIFSLALVILAVIVVIDGSKALSRQKKGEITGDPAVVETTK